MFNVFYSQSLFILRKHLVVINNEYKQFFGGTELDNVFEKSKNFTMLPNNELFKKFYVARMLKIQNCNWSVSVVLT